MPAHPLFAQKQAAIKESLDKNPLVAVFQVTTHDGKTTIEEDAMNKVEAMYAGGIRKFEFLLRGDNTLPLDINSPLGKARHVNDPKDTYVGQVLAAIEKIKQKYDAIAAADNDEAKRVTLAVGTVTSDDIMNRVVINPGVGFAMTAHYPQGENQSHVLEYAARAGVPIIPTVSSRGDMAIKPDGNGEIVEVKKNTPGNDMLDPKKISELRDKGIECFKASDFTEIAMKRAAKQGNMKRSYCDQPWSEIAEKDPKTRAVFGLIAVAEAIRDSYNGQVPTDKNFTVATTGGVDEKTLPYIAMGAKNDLRGVNVRDKITEIFTNEMGQVDPQAAKLTEILKRTTIGAGGTFMTKNYNDIIKKKGMAGLEEAKADLAKMARLGTDTVKQAQKGEVFSQRAVAA